MVNMLIESIHNMLLFTIVLVNLLLITVHILYIWKQAFLQNSVFTMKMNSKDGSWMPTVYLHDG